MQGTVLSSAAAGRGGAGRIAGPSQSPYAWRNAAGRSEGAAGTDGEIQPKIQSRKCKVFQL